MARSQLPHFSLVVSLVILSLCSFATAKENFQNEYTQVRISANRRIIRIQKDGIWGRLVLHGNRVVEAYYEEIQGPNRIGINYSTIKNNLALKSIFISNQIEFLRLESKPGGCSEPEVKGISGISNVLDSTEYSRYFLDSSCDELGRKDRRALSSLADLVSAKPGSESEGVEKCLLQLEKANKGSDLDHLKEFHEFYKLQEQVQSDASKLPIESESKSRIRVGCKKSACGTAASNPTCNVKDYLVSFPICEDGTVASKTLQSDFLHELVHAWRILPSVGAIQEESVADSLGKTLADARINSGTACAKVMHFPTPQSGTEKELRQPIALTQDSVKMTDAVNQVAATLAVPPLTIEEPPAAQGSRATTTVASSTTSTSQARSPASLSAADLADIRAGTRSAPGGAKQAQSEAAYNEQILKAIAPLKNAVGKIGLAIAASEAQAQASAPGTSQTDPAASPCVDQFFTKSANGNFEGATTKCNGRTIAQVNAAKGADGTARTGPLTQNKQAGKSQSSNPSSAAQAAQTPQSSRAPASAAPAILEKISNCQIAAADYTQYQEQIRDPSTKAKLEKSGIYITRNATKLTQPKNTTRHCEDTGTGLINAN